MANQIIEIDGEDLFESLTTNNPLNDIKYTGLLFQKKTVESLIAFSYCVSVLQQKCVSAESNDFTILAKDYWGLSASGASQTAKIGKSAQKFLLIKDALPASARALYELTILPETTLLEKVNGGFITPGMSTDDAKQLKSIVKGDKKTKLDENPFAKAKTEEKQEKENDGAPTEVSFPKEENTSKEPLTGTVISKNKLPVVDRDTALLILDIDLDTLYEEAINVAKFSLNEIDAAYLELAGTE